MINNNSLLEIILRKKEKSKFAYLKTRIVNIKLMSSTAQTDVTHLLWDETLDQNKNYHIEKGVEKKDQMNPINTLLSKPLLNKVNSLVDKQEIRKATSNLLDYLSVIPNDKKANDLALDLLKSRGWKM